MIASEWMTWWPGEDDLVFDILTAKYAGLISIWFFIQNVQPHFVQVYAGMRKNINGINLRGYGKKLIIGIYCTFSCFHATSPFTLLVLPWYVNTTCSKYIWLWTWLYTYLSILLNKATFAILTFHGTCHWLEEGMRATDSSTEWQIPLKN